MKNLNEEVNKIKHLFNFKKGDVISEQKDDINELLNQGYKDITSWYGSDEGKIYIPDGEYVENGSGEVASIFTKDGKDTGYVIVYDVKVRGLRKDKISISNNGTRIDFEGEGNVIKILLNDDILNKSGLSTK